VRAGLPAQYEYVFVDGELACEAADGVTGVYPGPYLCYHGTPTTGAMREAHAAVWEVIERDGPFDGELGFSQGASLAASVMLDRHMQMLDGRLDLTLPFRFAVFLCTGLPYDVQAGRGEDKTGGMVKPGRRLPSRPGDGARANPRVRGARDRQAQRLRGRGRLLMQMCEASQYIKVEHPDGHLVPRSPRLARDIARAIGKVIDMANNRC
jgi:hypothetical protein